MKIKQVQEKYIFLIVFLILNSSLVAQTFNIKAGLMVSNFSAKEFPEELYIGQQSKPNLYFAINTEFTLNNFISLETGLSINSKGYRESYRGQILLLPTQEIGTSYSVTLTYLDIPALAKIYFNNDPMRFYGSFGPYISLGLNGKMKYDLFVNDENTYTEEDVNWGSNKEFNSFSRFDSGILMNLGAELGEISMGVSYGQGLFDISVFNDSNSNKIRNKTWTFYVGYAI